MWHIDCSFLVTLFLLFGCTNWTYCRVVWRFCCSKYGNSHSHWPCGLRHRSAATCMLKLWVQILAGPRMSVSYECCVLSGRDLCSELITHPMESYWLWCIIVCDLEISWMRRPKPALDHSIKKSIVTCDKITKSGSKNEPGSYICYHSVFYFFLFFFQVDAMNKGISFKLPVFFCHCIILLVFV